MALRGKRDVSAIRDLVARLELECSSLTCVQLARALAYSVLVWADCIEVYKPGAHVRYTSLDAFRRALLRDARRMIGPR